MSGSSERLWSFIKTTSSYPRGFFWQARHEVVKNFIMVWVRGFTGLNLLDFYQTHCHQNLSSISSKSKFCCDESELEKLFLDDNELSALASGFSAIPFLVKKPLSMELIPTGHTVHGYWSNCMNISWVSQIFQNALDTLALSDSDYSTVRQELWEEFKLGILWQLTSFDHLLVGIANAEFQEFKALVKTGGLPADCTEALFSGVEKIIKDEELAGAHQREVFNDAELKALMGHFQKINIPGAINPFNRWLDSLCKNRLALNESARGCWGLDWVFADVLEKKRWEYQTKFASASPEERPSVESTLKALDHAIHLLNVFKSDKESEQKPIMARCQEKYAELERIRVQNSLRLAAEERTRRTEGHQMASEDQLGVRIRAAEKKRERAEKNRLADLARCLEKTRERAEGKQMSLEERLAINIRAAEKKTLPKRSPPAAEAVTVETKSAGGAGGASHRVVLAGAQTAQREAASMRLARPVVGSVMSRGSHSVPHPAAYSAAYSAACSSVYPAVCPTSYLPTSADGSPPAYPLAAPCGYSHAASYGVSYGASRAVAPAVYARPLVVSDMSAHAPPFRPSSGYSAPADPLPPPRGAVVLAGYLQAAFPPPFAPDSRYVKK